MTKKVELSGKLKFTPVRWNIGQDLSNVMMKKKNKTLNESVQSGVKLDKSDTIHSDIITTIMQYNMHIIILYTSKYGFTRIRMEMS